MAVKHITMQYSEFKKDKLLKMWIEEDKVFDYGTVDKIRRKYIEIHWEAANEIVRHPPQDWASIHAA